MSKKAPSPSINGYRVVTHADGQKGFRIDCRGLPFTAFRILKDRVCLIPVNTDTNTANHWHAVVYRPQGGRWVDGKGRAADADISQALTDIFAPAG